MENAISARVRSIFDKANFLQRLGVQLTSAGIDGCETTLNVDERHLQQHGYIHAGVIATLADHTAGGAASVLRRTRRHHYRIQDQFSASS